MNSGRRPHARAFAICSLLAFAALPASAQVALTTLGTAYTQNFDTLPASGTAVWANNTTLPGWYHARTGSGSNLVADTGASNAGNLYSYGASGNTDRALGSVGSGNAAVGSLFWGLRLKNTTGSTITALAIAYTGEQWRNSAATAQSIGFPMPSRRASAARSPNSRAPAPRSPPSISRVPSPAAAPPR